MREAVQGINFLLTKDTETSAGSGEAIYGAFKGVQRSILVGDFKLIAYPTVPKLRLYNLKKDPLEMNDCADKNKKVVKRLFGNLLEKQKELGDALDLTEPFKDQI